MTDPLGMSVGTINLVAVPAGHPAVLHAWSGPDETSGATESLADALETLGEQAGGGAPVWIAVPAYWAPDRREALRSALLSRPAWTGPAAAPVLITDAQAAIAALRAWPGLPSNGVVALCDFGGAGTSITLVEADADFAPAAPTVRYPDFSGEQIDQLILDHLLARLPDDATGDPAATAEAESLSALRDACRAVKERLSEQASTTIPVDLPGHRGDIRLTRDELDELIAAPLAGAVNAVSDTFSRNGIELRRLAAVATVGGGARIPLIGSRLTERLRVPVIATPEPECAAATGAAMMAGRATGDTSATALAAATPPTSAVPQAWTATEQPADDATARALAWSEDDSKAGEPVPFSENEQMLDDRGGPEPAGAAADSSEVEPLAWYQRPVVLFAFAAALALAATAGLAYTLTATHKPGGGNAPGQHSGQTVPPLRSPETVVVTAPDGSTSVSTIPPSPAGSTTQSTAAQSTTAQSTTSQTTSRPSRTETTTTTPPTTTGTGPEPTTRARSSSAEPSATAPATTGEG